MQEIIKCDECQTEFLKEKLYKHHKKYVHGEAKFECEYCEKRFKMNAHLKRHIETIHLKLKPYKCMYCDFHCSQKSNMKAHVCYKSHSEDGKQIVWKEYDIQKKLENETKGKMCKCEAGIVDILTREEIIEIKQWRFWKHSVGQVLCYHIYFPRHKPRIHFFGKIPPIKKLKAIENVLSSLNIIMTYEKY